VSPSLAGEDLHLRYLQKLLPPAAEAARALGSSRAAVQYLAGMADRLRAGRAPAALSPVPHLLYARVVPGEEAGVSAADGGEAGQRAEALAALVGLYQATSGAACVRRTDAGLSVVLPELQAQLLDA
jgi:hypothetical protein